MVGPGSTAITVTPAFCRDCISELTSVTIGFVCISMDEPQPIVHSSCLF